MSLAAKFRTPETTLLPIITLGNPYYFPILAIINYHKLGDLKLYKWRSDVLKGAVLFLETQGENPRPCLF